MTHRRKLLLPAAVLALTTSSTIAFAKPDAGPNDDLVRMGESLLDNGDLIRMGANLLEEDGGARKDAAAGADGAADASTVADAGEDAEAGEAPAAAAETPGSDGGEARTSSDGGVAAASSSAPSSPGGGTSPPRGGGSSRSSRIQSGANVDPEGPKESPFAKLGVPPAAVPVVATAASAGVMAVWPFIIKTLTGLLKGITAGLLKNRAKKGQKIDHAQRAFVIAGFVLRPIEIASLLVAALIYGLAVCYTLQGWKMAIPFVGAQELLIVAIYFSRSFVRFAYERFYKLATQYKFWFGGGLLCLGSAYLGNTLGTVGYELEGSSSPKDADRIIKMKVWLLLLALGMAVCFCVANLHAPAKILQSGRIMTSGMALGEIMPIAPMPGQKIYRWRKDVWLVLFVVVVPTFFFINLVL